MTALHFLIVAFLFLSFCFNSYCIKNYDMEERNMGITFKSVRQNNIVELIFWRSSIFNSIFESLRLYFIKKRKSKSNS